MPRRGFEPAYILTGKTNYILLLPVQILAGQASKDFSHSHLKAARMPVPPRVHFFNAGKSSYLPVPCPPKRNLFGEEKKYIYFAKRLSAGGRHRSIKYSHPRLPVPETAGNGGQIKVACIPISPLRHY